VPGFAVGRSPLAFFGAWRPEGGGVEVLVDDVLHPGVLGAGASLTPWGPLEVHAALVTDRRARRRVAGRDDRVGTTLEGAEVGLDLAWARAGRFRLAVRGLGQALASAGGAGFGARAQLSGRLRPRGLRRTTFGLDLGGGVAGARFAFDAFGPTYLAHRVETSDALAEADAARGTVHGQVFARRGPWALRLDYAQGLGPRALAFDRRTAVVAELAGVSLGGERTLELRVGHAARAPFAVEGAAHVLAASARLRLGGWASVEAFAQLGAVFAAGGGLSMTWVP
jgi:hypothetical protein